MSPRKAVSAIILGGLAGGVLGLSTLSFYSSDQQKHTKNISIGAAIGVIVTTIYVTASTASGKGMQDEPSEKEDMKKYDTMSLRLQNLNNKHLYTKLSPTSFDFVLSTYPSIQ